MEKCTIKLLELWKYVIFIMLENVMKWSYTKKGDERKQSHNGLIKVWQNHGNFEKSVVERSPECHRKD
jgi:hypothetical protein